MVGLRALLAGVLGLGVLLFAQPLPAQDYPTRYVRIITAGAGTFHDLVARQLAQRLSERWRQSVVVENQPAAGLTIGSGIAAKAAPDGYTLLLADRTALAAAPHLYRNLRYDPVKDFRPITLVARNPSVLVIEPGLGLADLRSFIDYARRQPQPIAFASAGLGTAAHLTGELFRQLTGIEMQTIQYKGGGDAALALLRGDVRFTALPVSLALPHLAAGKMKALALASTVRFAGAPDIPTGAEAGLPGFQGEQWVALVAPAGLPDAIADKLHRDVADVLRDPELGSILRAQGAELAPGSPAELTAFIVAETARLKTLIEAVGLRLE